MIIEPLKDLWVRPYAAISGTRLELRVFRWTLRSPCGGNPWGAHWEAIADDGIYYQAVIFMGAKLPLDHFWRSSYPSPIAVTSMSSATVIAPFLDSDRVYREFGDLEHLWPDWRPTAANPVVSTTVGEDFGDVHYEVKHQAGVFKQAAIAPQFTSSPARIMQRWTERAVLKPNITLFGGNAWATRTGDSLTQSQTLVSRRMPRSFGESRQARPDEPRLFSSNLRMARTEGRCEHLLSTRARGQNRVLEASRLPIQYREELTTS